MRNDAATWRGAQPAGFDNVVISPGPGSAERPAGLRDLADVLGPPTSRSWASASGTRGSRRSRGVVGPRPTPSTGGSARCSTTTHRLFAGIPQGFGRSATTRCGSSGSRVLRRSAWTADGTVMGFPSRSRRTGACSSIPSRSAPSTAGGCWRTSATSAARRARAPLARRPGGSGRPARPATSRPTGGGSTGSSIRRPRSCGCTAAGGSRTGSTAASSRTGSRASPTSARAAGRSAGSCPTTSPAGACVPDACPCRRTTRASSSYLERELAGLACAADDVPFDLAGGFVGYFGYEVKAGLRLAAAPPLAVARRARCILADRLIVFDHLEGHTYLVCLAMQHEAARSAVARRARARPARALARYPPPGRRGIAADAGPAMFARARASVSRRHCGLSEEIAAGESYEICLTNQLAAAPRRPAATLYRLLRRAIRRRTPPTCASATSRAQLVARALPARRPATAVEAKPIKGTAPRGATPTEDAPLARARDQTRRTAPRT